MQKESCAWHVSSFTMARDTLVFSFTLWLSVQSEMAGGGTVMLGVFSLKGRPGVS